MTERAFGWWVMASLALHMVGVAAGSFGRPSMNITSGNAVAIEVVRVPAPEPPPAPPPPPRVKAPLPRIVQRAPEPKPVPTQTPNLLDTPAPPAATPPRLDSTLAPSALPSMSTPVVGAPAGAGALFSSGDLLVAPGSSGSAGSGAESPRGQGLASAGANASQVALTGTGLTSLARPLGGGYQSQPEYPQRALKDGAEGTTVLKVEVMANGRVGEIVVARSAGRRDFDRAAIEAVKQWVFEPARRGTTAVAVWATLPVRFVLSER